MRDIRDILGFVPSSWCLEGPCGSQGGKRRKDKGGGMWGSGEGEAPGLVGEIVRSFQVMSMEAWGIRTAPHHVA